MSNANAEKLKVSIEYQLLEKEVVFTIQYLNPSSDTLVFWIQNWRLAILKDLKAKLRGFPYMSKHVNFMVFSEKSINPMEQLSGEEYYSSIEGEMDGVCMKKLVPKDTFVVEVVSRNQDLINFIKKQSFKITLLVSCAKIADLKKNGSFSEGLCFDSSLAKIEDIPIPGDGSNDFRTWNFGFSDRVVDPPVLYHNFGEGFNLYMIAQVPLRK
ncbi:hypothetical protein D4L85_01445 [Chryseolinea soli]|uniref:Uncharacterized protein n=2 Tax=Chryseolinea soli TaxID=2321403 RepID=A0A385SFZ4_9BACT|nr:hypothetical protein D4L85_01445 [Chryseolinea soli]